MTVLGLLGPAGSGKDTIAEIIAPIHLVELDGDWRDIRVLLTEAKEAQARTEAEASASGRMSRTVRRMLASETPTPTPAPPKPPALRARAAQIGLADPMKEAARKFYDFSLTQLWGPSEARNAPDERYKREFTEHNAVGASDPNAKCVRCGVPRNDPKPCGWTWPGPCVTFLSAREALQQLGSEYGRRLYADTWIDLGLRRAEMLLTKQRIEKPKDAHVFMSSWTIGKTDLVVVSDLRCSNDVRKVKEVGGYVWRIDRTVDTTNPLYAHDTEREQVKAKTDLETYVDYVIANEGTIDELRMTVGAGLAECGL